jgi:hypothetical protein
MRKRETLDTIWEVPDELSERIEPIILEEDPPKARGRKRTRGWRGRPFECQLAWRAGWGLISQCRASVSSLRCGFEPLRGEAGENQAPAGDDAPLEL